MDRFSKKATAEKLMGAGFSKWIGGTDQEIKNPKKITMMNGRPATQGVCRSAAPSYSRSARVKKENKPHCKRPNLANGKSGLFLSSHFSSGSVRYFGGQRNRGMGPPAQ